VKLANRTAFITGAANGIGRVAAELFAGEGAAVVLSDIDGERGEAAAEAIRAAGGNAFFIRTDVTDPKSVEAAITEAVRRNGRLDVLYNNAGGSAVKGGSVTEADDDDFWREISLNLYGTWLCSKFGVREIIKSGGGAVINTSSIVAVSGSPSGNDGYTASKGAVAALTRSMAVRYGRDHVRVNAVLPGVTLSERVVGRTQGVTLPQVWVDRHLLGFQKPEQVARAALFLASDDAAGITGQNIAVDSGYSIS